MNNRMELSFEELGCRELLKGPTYWLGLIATAAAAVYAYHKTYEEATK